MAYRLGIDLGTTNVVATVSVDGAPVELVGLGQSGPQMRSMLFLAEDGQLLIGDEAATHAAADPSRLIADPRRQLGTDVPLEVGGRELTPEDATGLVLDFVRDRAVADQGGPPIETVLSYPARWSEYQVDCFDRAIEAADLGSVRRCSEAEAAAATYAARTPLPEGKRVAVYDLGGGSCEITVLERTAGGFRTLGAAEGADHPSGADLDEAVYRLVLGGLGDRGRALKQDDPDARRRLEDVRRGCTRAKEELSTEAEAGVRVALTGYETTVRLNRREFESLVRPTLRESVTMMRRALDGAGVAATDLVAIVGVGGCCRMPLVAQLLEREFEVPVALGTHPEFDVAFGTLLLTQPGGVLTATSAQTPTPPDLVPVPPAPVDAAPVVPAPVVPEPVVPAPVVTAPVVTAPVVTAPGVAAAVAPSPAISAPVTPVPVTAPAPVGTADEESAVPVDSPEAPDPPQAADQPQTVHPDDEAPTEQIPAPTVSAATIPASATTPDSATTPQNVDQPSRPDPESPAPSQEETMADHLIFDFFSSTATLPEEGLPDAANEVTTPIPVTAGGAAPALPPWARASAPPPPPPPPAFSAGPSPTRVETPSPVASNPYPPRPPGQNPSGQRPPGQRPPGQRPPGRPGGPPSGNRGPGPQTQPYGAGGPGGPGGGRPPGPGGDGSGSSRKRLILIIAGAVVLAGAAFGIGVLINRPGTAVGPSPSVIPLPPVSSTPSAGVTPFPSPTPSLTPSPGSSQSGGPSPSGSASAPGVAALPAAAPLPASLVVVPMQGEDDLGRRLYLVDTDGTIDRVQLPTPEGSNFNPMMQPSRTTIIYLRSGVLRVMASDGTGDRKLLTRDPAGCDNVAHASWSLANPNQLLISCRVSKSRDTFLLIGLDGRLISRLDPGNQVIGDFGLSPDGQTVVYWSGKDRDSTGGAIYTLPIIGTGAPKQLTESTGDADPAWSPDSTQIAFRRRVSNGTSGGNNDVYVMNTDGSAPRAVAKTPASDFKPIWSPDNKNLLIISNRKSAFGGPGKTYDLWLTRVSDGEVLTNLGLKAKQITRPFWTLR